MKKLALIAALAVVSTTAFAGGWGGPKPQPCGVCETGDINVGAPQIQVTVLKDTAAVAKASGNQSTAGNNMSSNTYGVDLRAESIQITALKDSAVLAKASDNQTVAQNNMASNIGNVAVNAAQIQAVLGDGAFVGAFASGNQTRAIQNFSTNNACVTCQ